MPRKPSTKPKPKLLKVIAFLNDMSTLSGLRPMDPQREAAVDAWIANNQRKQIRIRGE